MPVFTYQGRGTAGFQRGEIEATDRTSAVGELRKRAILVTRIAEKAGGKTPMKIGSKVKDREMAIFTRQFSTMIDSGLPLVQCLNVLAEQSESKNLRAVTAQVAHSVESGSTLADGLRKHPRTFDDLFTNLVEVGEAGGILDIVLQRLAVYIEKAAALKRKVKSAMVYPLSIVGVAFMVVIFMLTFVIPTFATMFKEMGAELPLPTKVVVWLLDFVRGYILVLIAAMMGIVFALRAYRRTENGRSTIDALLLKVPVMGTLIRKVAVARFTRTLGTLVQCRASVIEGKTLADPLRSSGVFPPMVIQMISVGEQTGALDAMLAKIADFYDDEVDTAVTTLTSLLEPIMIVFLGVIIGGLVVA